jgi:two-component system chemotaxis response regulator CheY
MIKSSPNNEAFKNVRFLVIDDHSGTRSLVKALLVQDGFSNIRSCENGLEALKVLQEGEIDIVVCDWNMPVMSGIDLLREVRREEKKQITEYESKKEQDSASIKSKSRFVPFIMLTAEQDQFSVITAFEYGATDYIIKPFTQETLSGKVMRVIKNLNSG